ncbi:polymorphic toxin-type HINT domain-containing protein [Nocardiopsis sediminis]|uniref:Polymorphic toxin-type HINT domain-containing protein n=1 Tax=Nocardiopsis sediminis TaxID=1778267 RepID=A0ABV8FT98_9ACTN
MAAKAGDTLLRKIHDPERGANFVEYGAVILLVAAIASVVLSAGIPGRVTGLIDNALNSVDGEGEPEQQADGDDAPGDGADVPGAPDAPSADGDTDADDQGPGFDTADNPNPGDAQTGPAFTDTGDGTEPRIYYAGYGGSFGDSFMDGARESWEETQQEWGDFTDSPGGYLRDQAVEAGQAVDGAVDYVNQRRDEIAEATNERFSTRWDNGRYGAALGGWVGDAFADTLWRDPISVGGAYRGFRDSYFDDVAMQALDEGDRGAAHGRAAWNLFGNLINPIDRLRGLTPDGHRGGQDDQQDSSGQEQASGQNRNEDEENNEDDDQQDGASCPPGNSFVPGTPVLLADGSTLPIQDVDVGDEVLALDPLTGEEGPREVTDTITGAGEKTLVTIGIDAGDGTTDKITATDQHPFWVSETAEWTDAIDLEPGTWLRSSTGTWVKVTAIGVDTAEDQRVHNLTVEDLHTYYAVVGGTEVLSHNDNRGCGDLGEDWEPRDPNEICGSSGCEDVAVDIQQAIGGDRYRITDSLGAPYLGQYRNNDTGWGHHDVVIKDGRVYDAFSGRTGVPLDEYRDLWQYGEDLEFTKLPE